MNCDSHWRRFACFFPEGHFIVDNWFVFTVIVFSEGLTLIVDAKNTQVRFILADDNFNSDRISMYLCVTRVKKSGIRSNLLFSKRCPQRFKILPNMDPRNSIASVTIHCWMPLEWSLMFECSNWITLLICPQKNAIAFLIQQIVEHWTSPK